MEPLGSGVKSEGVDLLANGAENDESHLSLGTESWQLITCSGEELIKHSLCPLEWKTPLEWNVQLRKGFGETRLRLPTTKCDIGYQECFENTD